jgi:hypothetical protein
VGRKVRILLLVLVSLVVGAGLGAYALYRAAVQVPEFYAQAIKSDPILQRKANDEMLQQAANLANDVRKRGQWQATFTADQINGWLAVDLPNNYPEVLDADVQDPRVAIEPRRATIAALYKGSGREAVLSVNVDVYLSETNTIAVRLLSARIGTLPVPLAQVLEAVKNFATESQLEIRWAQADGDPVALIPIPPTYDENDKQMVLERLELRDGAVYVSGRTEPGGEPTPVAANDRSVQRGKSEALRISLRTIRNRQS